MRSDRSLAQVAPVLKEPISMAVDLIASRFELLFPVEPKESHLDLAH